MFIKFTCRAGIFSLPFSFSLALPAAGENRRGRKMRGIGSDMCCKACINEREVETGSSNSPSSKEIAERNRASALEGRQEN